MRAGAVIGGAFVAICLTGLGIPGIGNAQPGGGGGSPGPVRMAGAREALFIERHAEAIGIGADTLAAVKAAAEAGRKAAAERFEGVAAARKRLETLLREEQPDEASLLREVEVMGQAWTANLQERMRTTVKIRQLLTDAERKKLAELRAQPPRRAKEPLGAPSGPSPGMVIDRGAP